MFFFNPPTPPGSTGCEIVSVSPPLSPHPGIQVALQPPGGSPAGSPPERESHIYDIGTEIPYFQCFVTTDMFFGPELLF